LLKKFKEKRAGKALQGVEDGYHKGHKIKGLWWKFPVAIVIDVGDALIFFIGGVGPFDEAYDLIAAFVSHAMWGGGDLFGILELVDFTGTIDKFLPACTFSGIYVVYKQRKMAKTGEKPAKDRAPSVVPGRLKIALVLAIIWEFGGIIGSFFGVPINIHGMGGLLFFLIMLVLVGGRLIGYFLKFAFLKLILIGFAFLFPLLWFIVLAPVYTIAVLMSIRKVRKMAAGSGATGAGATAARRPGSAGIQIKNVLQPAGHVNTLVVIIILIMLILAIGLPLLARYGGGFEGLVGKSVKAVSVSTAKGTLWLKENNPIRWVQDFWKKTYHYATGGIYEGEVEENRYERLGVYIEDIEASDPEFYEDEEIIVWGVLKAFTLDKPINISLKCNIGDTPADDMSPRGGEINVLTFEEAYLECKWNKDTVYNNIKAGAKVATFNAIYNFKTMSYVKSYFMDEERLRSMRRGEIDVLEEYGIDDKFPIAVYTNGPVKIGMQTRETLPIGISDDVAELREAFVIGITLENRWKGQIKNVSRLEMQLPDSLSIHHCDHLVKDPVPADEPGYMVYELDLDKMSARKRNKFENIKLFQSWKCWIDVADRDKLLGATPISTKYIRLTATYEYKTFESKVVYVRALDKDETPGVSGTSTYTRGCCQVSTGKCNRDASSCDTTKVSREGFCGNEGLCLDCVDVCNAQTQCPSGGVGLVDYGWCCQQECDSGSLLNEGAGYFDDSITDSTYLGLYISDTEIEKRLTPLVLSEAKQKNVDYFLIKALIQRESSWDASKIGYKIKECTEAKNVPAGVCDRSDKFVFVDEQDNYIDQTLSEKVKAEGIKQSYGISQMKLSTANKMGCDIGQIQKLDAEEGIRCSVTYLQYIIKYLRDNDITISIENIAAAYNAGEGAVKEHNGVPPYAQTETHVVNVVVNYNKLKSQVSV